MRFRLALVAVAQLTTLHCASPVEEPEAATADELRAAPDRSPETFLGKWESTVRDVPEVGRLPFESNLRSLEFTSTRDDSSSYVRFRLVQVIRPDCADCKDEIFPKGTYRSIASSPSDLNSGKLYVTEGGNTSSRFFYRIEGDELQITGTGYQPGNRTVVRKFKRVPQLPATSR
jgi:hypothetical protein